MSGHTRDRMKKAATEAAERLAKRADFYTDKDELDDVKAVLAEHVACFEDFRAACGRLPIRGHLRTLTALRWIPARLGFGKLSQHLITTIVDDVGGPAACIL